MQKNIFPVLFMSLCVIFSASGAGGDGINHLYNGGFETETNPGMADGWGPFYYNWGVHGETSFYQDLQALIHVDRKEAFEGRNSLRMLLPPGLKELNLQHPFIRSMINGKEAVFSVYMKSFRKGGATVSLWIRFLGSNEPVPAKTFHVDDSWKRYELRFRMPRNGRIQPWIRLTDGIVWIDGAKLEHGSEATPFDSKKKEEKDINAVAGSSKNIQPCIIPVLDRAPEMTGKMSDPIWEKGLCFNDFYRTKNGGKVTENTTKARMFIHDTTLYIAFECYGRNSVPMMLERDDMVWTDDCVEVFLDPGGNMVHDAEKAYGSYYHFIVNAAGTLHDIYTGGEIKAFDGRIRTKTFRSANQWSAEIAVDLASLHLTPVTESWRFMLAREDHTNHQDCAIVPLPGTFHDYGSFAAAKIDRKVFDKLNAMKAAAPELDGNKLKIRLVTVEKTTGKINVNILRGKTLLLKKEWTQTLDGETVLHVPLSLNSEEPFTVRFAVRGSNGESLFREWELAKETAVYFRYSYYTDETQAELIWGVPFPSEQETADFNGIKIPWTKKDGSLFFDLKEAPNGNYSVRIGGREIPFEKYPPRRNEVKIDRRNNMLVADGKPFLFYGPFIPFSFAQRFILETTVLPELRQRGFNGITLMIPEGYVPGEWAEANRCWDISWYISVLDACHANGMKVIVFCPFEHQRGKGYISVFNPRTLIPHLKDHPALLAWYISDEPTPEHYQTVWDLYRFTKKNDPYHPVMVNVTDQGLATKVVMDKKTGRNPFDVFSLTFYPVSRVTAPDNRLKDTLPLFDKMREAVRKEHGVLMHAAQAYGYGTDHWYREPTPEEIAFLVYMPLIYGNTGWMWFGGRAKCPATQKAIESYIPELRELAPILGNGVMCSQGRVFQSVCGNVIGTLRKYGKRCYLITVNKMEKAVKTHFNLADAVGPEISPARVLFENRRHDLQTDDLYRPFQRHVYEFTVD